MSPRESHDEAERMCDRDALPIPFADVLYGGPWMAEACADGDWNVFNQSGVGLVCRVSDGLIDRAEDMAKLISAAPKMKAAIDSVLRTWKRAGPQGSHQFEKFDYCIRLCEIVSGEIRSI